MKRVARELPDWLEPVLGFVNTVDVETGADDLAAGPSALGAWLAERDLFPAGTKVSHADHRLALDLRSGLRFLALRNNSGSEDPAALAHLTTTLGRLPLVASVTAWGPVLRPYRLAPTRAALGTIAAGYAQAVGTGDWSRIRRCPADDCAWVFWDSSAKGARRWCTMRVCGNRAKVRAYAQRNQATAPQG
ncbi:CGNR zinc finger domain-containing protein [Actinocrispum wychmicini]|uniref:Putative stress-induced transcription regulator n=1 Tax=Actinocrispum wychmicini TaxID=1213861 RepID=A0A4R2JL18_9PSEU|nr:CGNR zinc finger domain-containing protein [Actinocrispum wychmicini]TCO60711.1 putative stress-induced transcription regulator [Actinocrispum wychmicini]